MPTSHILACWLTEADMSYEAINFGRKFKLFDELWQPKVIAEMNDYQFKIVKLKGDFIWHDHIPMKRSSCSKGFSGSISAMAASTCRRAKCSLSRKESNTNL